MFISPILLHDVPNNKPFKDPNFIAECLSDHHFISYNDVTALFTDRS